MHSLADFAELPLDVQHALDIPGKSLGWRDVSMTQLSIARWSGIVTVNGDLFTYFAATDELIRDDVLRAIVKHKRAKAEAALDRMADNAQQLGLGL